MQQNGLIEQILDLAPGRSYLLRLLAEECGELTQAALKLVRARIPGETPVREPEARDRLAEEVADVWLMIQLVIAAEDLENTIPEATRKARRMLARLKEARR